MKALERERERIRKATCTIEEWIEAHGNIDPKYLKRLDKAVFMIKCGAKILKRANKAFRKLAVDSKTEAE